MNASPKRHELAYLIARALHGNPLHGHFFYGHR